MSDTPAIDVQQLEKEYREGWISRRKFKALQGVDLRVQPGEVFGLLGPNGAGKTTLIKILLGIVRSTGGRASLLGQPAGSKNARREIGYLPENLSFPAHHTAISALRLYGRLSYVPENTIRSRSQELLELVGLSGRETELVKKYSKGMRQRLGLAQALLHDPKLLIMDEPTDGLDPVGRSQIRQLIALLRDQGKTVFLNSHILQEVELICDRVAILAKGQVRGVGTPAELTSQFHGALASKVRVVVSGPTTGLEDLCASVDCEVVGLPDGSQQLSANATSQEDVDRLVDLIRQNQLSLRKLERTSLTLEEVFLSAVNSESAEESALRAADQDPDSRNEMVASTQEVNSE